MSDIVITAENIPQFSKRLQKALSDYLNKKVPLNDAYMLFAKTAGKSDLHELQQILKSTPLIKDSSDENLMSILDLKNDEITTDKELIKIHDLLKDIASYTQNIDRGQNKDSVIKKIEVFSYRGKVALVFTFVSKNKSEEVFVLHFYFYHPPHSSIYKDSFLSDRDVDFLSYLFNKYYSNDAKENIVFGNKLSKYLNNTTVSYTDEVVNILWKENALEIKSLENKAISLVKPKEVEDPEKIKPINLNKKQIFDINKTRVESLMNFIKNHIANHKGSTNIEHIEFSFVEGEEGILFKMAPPVYGVSDTNSFKIHFNKNPLITLNYNIKKSILMCSHLDKVFLQYVCDNFFGDDLEENVLLGKQIQKYINVVDGKVFIFYDKNREEVALEIEQRKNKNAVV